jgi:hypothetical protein
MNRSPLAIPAVILALALVARPNPPVSAQDSLARRISSAPNGTAGITFRSRAGICGDGQTFISELHEQSNSYSTYLSHGVNYSDWGGTDLCTRCVEGPVRVIVEVRNGTATALRPYVGGAGPARARTELGEVTVAEAVSYLLQLARRDDELTSPALLAAYLGEGSRITPTLFGYARDGSASPELRESALKYIGRAAEREETLSQALVVAREVMAGRAPIEVRERAIRVLAELPGGAAVVGTHYASLDEYRLQERAVRVVAEVGGAENARWIQAIALDEKQPLQVRERAIRVLADELAQPALLRSLYRRLDDLPLQERVIRLVAEHGTREDFDWLENLVVDPATDFSLRDRAVRSLDDAGLSTQRLAALYDRADDAAVRDRIIRLLAEHGDDASVDKLIEIARTTGDHSLRTRAIKSLGESRSDKARRYLESITQQREEHTVTD